MIIVDTSIWVDHIRGIETLLIDILGSGQEMLHPFVYGELLLNGLPKRSPLAERLQGIKSAPLAPAADIAAFIEWGRLAGTGIGYVDTHLLVSARLVPNGMVMTKDKNLAVQAKRFDLEFRP